MSTVSRDEARRIAVRAQLLDRSAVDVLGTVRALGSLQIDPISTVAPPQRLVLWSRLGSDAGLDSLLWTERKLFEWNAFVWPMDAYPLVRALMRRRRTGKYSHERRADAFLAANAAFRRFVLRELRERGPLLARDIEDRSRTPRELHGWTGGRGVTEMLEILHSRGVVAIVGRRDGQRLWGPAEEWFPKVEPVPVATARRRLAERRALALGVRLTAEGWEAHPDVADGAVPDRVTFLSPFDRLVYDRERAEALFGFRYRLEMYVPKAKREYGYYVLPILRGAELIGRIEPVFDRRSGVLSVQGVWAEPGAPPEAGADIARVLHELAAWLGATRVEVGKRVPRPWSKELRA